MSLLHFQSNLNLFYFEDINTVPYIFLRDFSSLQIDTDKFPGLIQGRANSIQCTILSAQTNFEGSPAITLTLLLKPLIKI